MIRFSTLLLIFTLVTQVHAQQQLSPEEKALQAAHDMQKRLGLQDRQIHYIYSINLIKIQKTRTVKEKRAEHLNKLNRDYLAISEEYNHRLRSILTPEQYQRWEMLRAEALERRKIIQQQLLADNNSFSHPELSDPEAELEHLVSR